MQFLLKPPNSGELQYAPPTFLYSDVDSNVSFPPPESPVLPVTLRFSSISIIIDSLIPDAGLLYVIFPGKPSGVPPVVSPIIASFFLSE